MLADQRSVADYDRVLALILSRTPPTRWVDEFFSLSDAWSISRFLKALTPGLEFHRLVLQDSRLEGSTQQWMIQ